MQIAIQIIGIIIAAVVALLIADLQRRQMRQIELFRANLTQSVISPPHPVAVWLKDYGPSLFLIGIGLEYLIAEFFSKAPVTPRSISMTGVSSLNVAFGALELLWIRMMHHMRDVIEIQGRVIGVLEKMVEPVSQPRTAE